MGQIEEMYSDSDIRRLEGRISLWTKILVVTAVLALAVCVGMAAMTETANAERMELGAVATSTVAGWFVLYGWIFILRQARRELAHARMLRSEARDRYEGTVRVTGEQVAIHKSITALRVEVDSSDGTTQLLVVRQRGDALKAAAGTGICGVYTVHDYVAAIEVMR